MAGAVNKIPGTSFGLGEDETPLPTRDPATFYGTDFRGGSPLQRMRADYAASASARAAAPPASGWVGEELAAWAVNQDPITRALGWSKTRGPGGTTYRTKGGASVSASTLAIGAGVGLLGLLLLLGGKR